jgi:hypothetical protein
MPSPATASLLRDSDASAPPAPLLAWRDSLGLWGRPSAGHTRPVSQLPHVHSGVESAVLLHALLELDLLDEPTLSSALAGLLDLQVQAGPLAGCFRWYAEEDEPTDTNAAFFIGLALQLLALDRPERIPDALRPSLDHAFELLNRWLLAELARQSPVYPNKYLGDLVCAWLGHELLERPAPPSLVRALGEALAYWENQYWGWGEHLSDIYAGVLLAEFSALLLFARRLPPALREQSLRLVRGLLAIDDAFGDGPRVPQIRCYDFAAAPRRLSFRGQIGPWPAEADRAWAEARALRRYMLLPFGPLFARHGWSDLFPAPAGTGPSPAGRTLEIPLADGATASAWIAPTLRTGALSRWPLLPGAENQRWGLSWQTFPAAYWRPGGEWGFLRCTTRRDQDVRAHPALDKAHAYLANALGSGEPPPLMRTVARQIGPAWLALRALDACPAAEWDCSRDGFWLHGLGAAPLAQSSPTGGESLLLAHPDGALRLRHFPLDPAATPDLARLALGAWSWTAPASAPALWCLEPAGQSAPSTPRITVLDRAVIIDWPGSLWDGTRFALPAVS